MVSPEGMRRRRLPYDAVIHTRQPVEPGTSDVERESLPYDLAMLSEIRDQLGNYARLIENRSHVVDEYDTAPITGAASASTVSVSPTYEYMPEKIESIIVAGPAGNITLVLGDRQMPLVIPASGILVIAPVAMLLGRSDPRYIQAQTPGQYFLELMGIADRRFSI